MSRTRRRGFTLVELLVVIGIIALLIGILLPALSRARIAALKTQDLSNCRQIVTAAVAYATNNKGVYPLGTRTYTGSNDDWAWIGSDTYDYFLQFCGSSANVANGTGGTRKLIATDVDNSTGVISQPGLLRVMGCNSITANPITNQIFKTNYYNYSSTIREMQMGWVYWGNRAWTAYQPSSNSAALVAATPAILDDSGNATGEIYHTPVRQGLHPTTRTLVTCYAYDSPGYSCYMPHRAYNKYGTRSIPATLNMTTIRPYMDGMCVGYIDGSARYVAPGDLSLVKTNASTYYFYDNKSR